MTQDINHILSTQYPASVKDAVRYGYQYRKNSEVGEANIRFSLPGVSAVLLWIAKAVASGVVYDVIKESVKHLVAHLKEKQQKLDEETKRILEDNEALREFTIYLEEYYAHDMKITIEQEIYIKEEVVADACAKEAGKIYKETGRFVFTKEECIHIEKVARKRADELIHRHK